MSRQTSTVIQLALIAVFTPLVCVATMVFSIYIPATRGFFNIGETMIYCAALLFGPIVGAFAGGIGSSLADVLLGFYYYAPATLVIKALEGGIVGVLGHKKPQFRSKRAWRVFTFLVGFSVGTLLSIIGSIYYVGQVELYLGIPAPPTPNVVFFVVPEYWYLLGTLVIFLITSAGFVLEPEFGWLAFTTITGGAIMVSGYFLYQTLLLFPLFGVEAVAIAEIPINIGQMLIGSILALPIIRILQRSLPQLKNRD